MSTINSVNTQNYSKYNNETNKSSASKSVVDAWFDDPNKNMVSVESFLELMIAQLKNQDFNDPVDDTQYITQLAQFATMQNMQDLAYYSKANFVNSLLGKEVTVSKLALGGNMSMVTGTVSKISLVNGEFVFFIGEDMYKLDQISEVKMAELTKPEEGLEPKENDEAEDVETVE